MRTSYDPFFTIRRLQDEMNRAFGGALTNADDNSASATSHWVPAVDIYEEGGCYIIAADVPGVDPSTIDITLEQGVLGLSGERKAERSDSAGSAARRVERVFGNFYRRFTLPDTADADRVEARCVNGVLEITIPKKATPQPKKITVGS